MMGSSQSQSAVSEPSAERRAGTLIVDDVEALRSLYAMVLETQGPFEVVGEAGDGEAAIDAAGEHKPELVLLDLSMPGMDGLEALPKIREVSPESTVVVLSGFLEERIGARARELGAAAYLEKGDNPKQLVERLTEILEWDWTPASSNGSPDKATLTPSDKELQQFAYTASHDLQEPLRMVASYLDLFHQRYGEGIEDDGLELLARAFDGVERMQSMIDGLLAYSRVETRGNPFGPVDLETMVADAVANLQLKVDEADAILTHDALPTVPADQGQILQLFQNLLENAIKFHEGQPRIHVSAEATETHVQITIEDDGPGIPEEELGRIFSLFERGSSAANADGAGIGLAICQRIVQRHNGSITIGSTHGDGTTVTLTLPLEQPDTQEDAA